jgi:general secretion pathway protein I
MLVISIALTALIKATTQTVNVTQHLQNKTFSQWVALNKFTELQISKQSIRAGNYEGSSEMANQQWFWEMNVSKTVQKSLLRVEINVSLKENDPPINKLIAFLGSQ